MKKLIIGLAVLVMSALGIVMLPTQSAYASGSCDSSHFLGLPAWYDGLTTTDTGADGKTYCVISSPDQDSDGSDVKAYVWTIVLNVMGLITGLIGYLAIAFVIWGGILYMIGQGDPGKIAKGKKTIQNSIIGLIITMTASILSGSIASIVASARESATKTSGQEFFQSLFNKVFVWSGVVAVIMIVYGGIQYTTSAGNSAGVAKAKSTIIYSVVGLLVVILAAAIVNAVIGAMPD